MKIYLFFLLLIGLFFITIVAAYKPEEFKIALNKIEEPVVNYIAEIRADEWRVAKDKAWQAWQAKHKLPYFCAHPRSSIQALECQNDLQNQADTFNSIWSAKVASGWKPDGFF